MTTSNIYSCVAINGTCIHKPSAWFVRIVARAASEYTAVEGMTVIGSSATALGVITRGSIVRVVWRISVCYIRRLTIRPAGTFRQRRSIISRSVIRRNQIFQCLSVICAHNQMSCRPLIRCIATIDSERSKRG